MRVRALLELAFPILCPGCGQRGEPVCAACAAGLSAPPPAPPPPGVDMWVAPFAYEGVARELVARAKYRDARAAMPWLADAVARAVARHHTRASLDALTWAPTTAARRRARGYDQAALLAGAVGRTLAVPARAMLSRRAGPPQTGLPARERGRGPVFALRRVPVPERVLLVDDVATTGATLAAAARTLRSGGAAVIVAAVAARTPPRPAPRPPG